MQCDCEVAVDGKRFAKLCKEHHDMKVRAMTRERLYCHNVVEALMSESEYDDYRQAISDALDAIRGLSYSTAGIDDHRFR